MYPVSHDQLLALVFNKDVIDGFFHIVEKLDEYDKKQRYDDNRKKLLVNALRLFEQGQLTKQQLKAVVDLLPETRVIEAIPVKEDVSDLLNKILNQ